MELLHDKQRNKGLSFTIEERFKYGLNGLLPSIITNQESEIKRIRENIKKIENDVGKYIYLMHLMDYDERLFFKLLESNVEEIMPLIYTPTVGNVCINYGFIFTKPKGMFITINDEGRIYEVLCNWPVDDVKIIVVTDGERILGLGDLGSQGMGIPVGKLALYTALAGVNPRNCLPIQLDVGTNNNDLLNDPYYIGLKQPRLSGDGYFDFLDEFMIAVCKRFGSKCLIQFEDFGNKNAFILLKKYENEYCVFNDDIQGTASVALAGILTMIKITKKTLLDNVFLFFGSGEAAIGIANLIVLALKKSGLSKEKAIEKIFLIDSKGLITNDRLENLSEQKKIFVKNMKSSKDLLEIINKIKPTVLIGCAGVGKKFTREVLEKMAELNERPLIFALSNPTSKAECTAEEAYTYTNGKAVFASGSPFSNFVHDKKNYITSQANNCYIFPAFGLLITSYCISHITDELLLEAAKSLSGQVTEKEMDEGRVYPNLNRIKDVSFKIAVDVAKYANSVHLCHLHPKPHSFEEHIRQSMYDPTY